MDSGSKERGIRGDRGIAGPAMGKGEADVCVSARREEGRGKEEMEEDEEEER